MTDTIEIKDIRIEDRQRRELGDLDGDFASVKELGLIQPVVVEHGPGGYRLVAGGRRLAWLTANGYTKLWHGVTCDVTRPGYVLSSEMTALARQEAELYENIKRKSLLWKEECLAIARIHRARWVNNKSEALAWSQRHTAKLLGIGDLAKVSYALQIADELRANPDGDMAKCENFTSAIKCLLERRDVEGRAEQDKRRALELASTPVLPGADIAPSEPPSAEPDVTIWLSRMVYHGDFNTIAERDLAPEMFQVAVVFGDDAGWLAQTTRLLKHDAVVLWCHGVPRTILHPELRYLGYPVVWNVLDLEPDPEVPFFNNQFYISVLVKGEPRWANPCATSVVSAPETSGAFVPSAVMEYLLRAVSLSGDQVLMPCSGPCGVVARLGRRPVMFTANEIEYKGNRAALMDYYNELYSGRVVFK